jgi:hypothetical protein
MSDRCVDRAAEEEADVGGTRCRRPRVGFDLVSGHVKVQLLGTEPQRRATPIEHLDRHPEDVAVPGDGPIDVGDGEDDMVDRTNLDRVPGRRRIHPRRSSWHVRVTPQPRASIRPEVTSVP